MNNSETNMFEELFIKPDGQGEYQFPSQSKEDCRSILDSDAGSEEKSEALFMLCEAYRCEASGRSGKLDAAECDELIKLIKSFEAELGEEAGTVLLRQGARSEKFLDFESALKFYEASLSCEIKNPTGRYYRLNNLAFCLNVMRRFVQAEEFLRAATSMEPLRYNAWKNLGVSLELQGKHDEAAECYFRAVCCSQGEKRSVRHFLRLLDRQPALATKYPGIQNQE